MLQLAHYQRLACDSLVGPQWMTLWMDGSPLLQPLGPHRNYVHFTGAVIDGLFRPQWVMLQLQGGTLWQPQGPCCVDVNFVISFVMGRAGAEGFGGEGEGRGVGGGRRCGLVYGRGLRLHLRSAGTALHLHGGT
jgi:hypothetical protein